MAAIQEGLQRDESIAKARVNDDPDETVTDQESTS